MIEAVRMSDKRAINAIELAVRFGKILILQEVDKIEPILYPLLRRELTIHGGSSFGAFEDEDGGGATGMASKIANNRFSVQI